jgi:hypothetical protein
MTHCIKVQQYLTVIETTMSETFNPMCYVPGRADLQAVSGTFCTKRVWEWSMKTRATGNCAGPHNHTVD